MTAQKAKDAAMDLAESARQQEWESVSFTAELFKGNFRWDLVHPFPAQSPEDRKIGDEYIEKILPVIEQHVDPWKIDEEGEYAESDPTIAQVKMAAWKTGRIIKVTDEQLNDSFTSIENYVSMKFAKSTTKAEEAAFVTGNGTKKPTGFLVTAEVGKTTASTTSITADELIDTWGSLDEDYAANAVWKMNRNTLVAIMKLKDSNGDYLVNKGLNGAPATLLGRPIVINKHMPAIAASAKPISFGDMSYYFIKDRTSMNMKRLEEAYAKTGHIGFRIDKRVDGKLVLPEAVKVLQMAAA
jgi:HK97 family phage major capsid protein